MVWVDEEKEGVYDMCREMWGLRARERERCRDFRLEVMNCIHQ
jgi:hypothetical protein